MRPFVFGLLGVLLVASGRNAEATPEPYTACGGNITGQSGEIYSHEGYDGTSEYGHNLDCQYTITVNPVKSIRIEFVDFNVENGADCSYDKVTVTIDGVEQGPFCGTDLPTTMSSASNSLVINWHSDKGSARTGWHLRWTEQHVGTPDECVFPFQYDGKDYYTCTTANSDRYWCGLSYEYSTGNYTNCDNFEPSCRFPFSYNGTHHNNCIDDDSDGMWCGITFDYDSDQQRIDCPGYELNAAYAVKYQNYSNEQCVFPFSYYGVNFTTCTSMNDTRPWCATENVMAIGSGDYVYCDEVQQVSGPVCFIPSIDNGQIVCGGSEGGNGEECNVACDSGYYSSHSTVTCGPDGTFNTIPTCDAPVILQGTDTDGEQGDWGTMEHCPEGMFAYAYDIKSEANQELGDDTAVNAVRLYCMHYPDTSETGPLNVSITSSTEQFGDWGSVEYCPGGNNPITGFKLKIEDSTSGAVDVTGLNKMEVHCRNGHVIEADSATDWGVATQQYSCPDGYAVAGIQTRVHQYGGQDIDDTSVNGVRLLCKKYVSTGCGGMQTGTEGFMYSHAGFGSTNYNDNQMCQYDINVEDGKQILIDFSHMDIEAHANCFYDYVWVQEVTMDGTIIADLGKFCGNVVPDVIVSTGNNVRVTFFSDGAVNGPGWRAEWYGVNLPAGSSGPDSTGSTADLTGLFICNQQYLDATPEWQTLKSTNSPGNYGNEENCGVEIIADETVHVSIEHLNLETNYDYLRLYDGPDTSSPLIAQLTGSNDGTVMHYYSTGSRMLVHFISDVSTNMDGFVMSFKSEQRKDPYEDVGFSICNQTHLEAGQDWNILKSDNYPENYDNSLDCGVTIHSSNGTVKLYLGYFALEPNADFVRIYDGFDDASPLLAELTGSSNVSTNGTLWFQQEIYSYGPEIFIKFSTDATLTGGGFVFGFMQHQSYTDDEEVVSTDNQESGNPFMDLLLETAIVFDDFYTTCRAQSGYLDLNGYRYGFVNVALSYKDARDHCLSRGGDLAYHGLEDMETRRTIREHLNIPDDSQVWSIMQKQEDGSYKNPDGNTVESIDWIPGEPNGDGLCADWHSKSYDTDSDLRYNDRPCDIIATINPNFVCEFKCPTVNDALDLIGDALSNMTGEYTDWMPADQAVQFGVDNMKNAIENRMNVLFNRRYQAVTYKYDAGMAGTSWIAIIDVDQERYLKVNIFQSALDTLTLVNAEWAEGYILATGEFVDYYVGCFMDKEERDFLTASQTGQDGHEMTVFQCRHYCAENYPNSPYFAVQAGWACFCSPDNWSPENARHGRVDDSECSMPCTGDGSQTCGNHWRNQVYRISGSFVKSHRVGCFQDDADRDFIENSNKGADSQMTVDRCRDYCQQNYPESPYFAVQNGQECFCSPPDWNPSNSKYGKVDDSECSTRCYGDYENADLTCGGEWRNEVFTMGDRHFQAHIGCFIDDIYDRDFPTVMMEDENSMTLEMCHQHCKTSYPSSRFFSLQAGRQCFCSDQHWDPKNSKHGRVHDSECNVPCTGNNEETCGADYRNQVFPVQGLANMCLFGQLFDMYGLSGGFRYKYFTEGMNYNSARAHCQGMGGDLARLDNADQRRSVRDYFNMPNTNYYVWTAMTIDYSDYIYRNPDGSMVSPIHWVPGSPGYEGSCNAWVSHTEWYDLNTDDVSCDDVYAFVCEFDCYQFAEDSDSIVSSDNQFAGNPDLVIDEFALPFYEENYSSWGHPDCVFPFEYNGKQYMTCTSDDDTMPWCSNASVMDSSNANRVYCQENSQQESTNFYICDQTVLEAGTEWAVLKSTNHPDNYGHSETCGVNIHTGAQNSIVHIHIEYLNTEGNYDFIRFYDGSDQNSPLLAEHSGSLSDVEDILSSGENLFVMFTSDYSTAKDGFRVMFKYDVPEDQFENWGHPQCVFPFTYYGEYYTGCTANNSTRPWCATASNFEPASGNWVYCEENQDSMNSTEEYYICELSSSGIEANDEWQTLKSTNHPNEHDNNEHCSVHIHSNGHVALQVDYMNLESNYDYVRVYDGDSDSDPMLAELTGSMFVDEIHSTGNNMFVVFSSDGSQTNDGFRLNFKSVDSQDDSRPEPDHDHGSDLHCEQYEGTTCGMQTAWRCSYAQWRLDFYGNWMNTFKRNNNMFDYVNSLDCIIPEEMVQCSDSSMKVCHQSAIDSCPVCYCADHQYLYPSTNSMRTLWNRDYQIWSRMMNEASHYQHNDDSNYC